MTNETTTATAHGGYQTPADVLGDDRLSHSEKKTILEEWHSALQHILRNEPDAPQARETSENLKAALDELAGKQG